MIVKACFGVLAAWLLAAGAIPSSDLTPSLKNFDILDEGDVNFLDKIELCEFSGIATPIAITIVNCTEYPCHVKPGRTYTVRGTILPGGNPAGFFAQAMTKVLGKDKTVFNQRDDHFARGVMGEEVTLEFTFKIPLLEIHETYNVTMRLFGLDNDFLLNDLQFCGTALGTVSLL